MSLMTPELRLATEDDATGVSLIYEPIVTDTHISFETMPPSPQAMRERIQTTLERFPWLVCEENNEVAGYAYASPHKTRDAYQWSVDVTVYVHEDYRRRGVARGLYESLFAVLRLQGVTNAYAVIALPNRASVRFHESLGFERIGLYHRVGFKNGEWRDVGHWELILQSHPAHPNPLTPLADLRGTETLADAVRAGEPSIHP